MWCIACCCQTQLVPSPPFRCARAGCPASTTQDSAWPQSSVPGASAPRFCHPRSGCSGHGLRHRGWKRLPPRKTLPDAQTPPSSPPHPSGEKYKPPSQQTPPRTNSGDVSLALKPQAWAVVEPHGERARFCFSSDCSDALLFSGVWPFVLCGPEPGSTS